VAAVTGPIWDFPSCEDAEVDELSRALGLEPVIARLLCLRGVRTPDAARSFLKPSLDQLHDPFRLADMAVAVDRLLAAPAGRPVAARDPSGRMQPLCARYPREVALAACDRLIAAGELRMGRLLDELDPLAVDAPEDVLLNINTDLDLARAESLLRG